MVDRRRTGSLRPAPSGSAHNGPAPSPALPLVRSELTEATERSRSVAGRREAPQQTAACRTGHTRPQPQATTYPGLALGEVHGSVQSPASTPECAPPLTPRHDPSHPLQPRTSLMSRLAVTRSSCTRPVDARRPAGPISAPRTAPQTCSNRLFAGS